MLGTQAERSRITNVVQESDGLVVTCGGTTRRFGWLWLRDHSQASDSFHPAARQRLIDTQALPADAPSRVESDDRSVRLYWPDSDPVQFTADYLSAVGRPETIYDPISGNETPWRADTIEALCPVLDHAAFLSDDDVLREALSALRRIGVVRLRDVPTEKRAFRQAMERIGYLRSSIFGDIWELRADGKMADTGSTPLEIDPHTDGTYNHDAPGVMALMCMEYEAEGGANVLVDGFTAALDLRESDPEAYATLSRVGIPGQYIGEGAYLVATRPPLRHDALGRLVQVSYNNHDRAPFHLPEEEMEAVYRALGAFHERVTAPENKFVFDMRPGDMAIFDNWRLLHARKAFTGSRHMLGTYVNREDYESRIRMLSPQPLDMVG